MHLTELHDKLIEAYSLKNLNRITRHIIDLYKAKHYGVIREIASKISPYVPIIEEKDVKCFSKLVLLYHPDKCETHRKNIRKYYAEKNLKKLSTYSHIFLLDDFDKFARTINNEELDYNPEYIYEEELKDDTFDTEQTEMDFSLDSNYENSFYNAIKLREYGHLDIEFPYYYLEDISDIELVDQGIELLDGVEHCKQLVSIDLSNNRISDVSELWNLKDLEEIYLANNQIGYIDALSNLGKLRIVDISGNQINDISPLFELDQLELVNLCGNPVPPSQIAELQNQEVVVIY